MKKLALALVCFASVAFFASCTKTVEHPEPSIAVKTGDSYISDGAVLNTDTEYKLGIRAASNTETKKDLANFKLETKIFSMEGLEVKSYDSTWLINGSEFEYEEVWSFVGEAKELVGKATITATVTDVAGEINSVTLNLSLNKPAQDLEPVDFEWNRHGAAAVTGGIEEVGLQWTSNGKEDFAILKPLEDAVLYGFTSDDWGKTVTDLDKANLFSSENNVTMDKFTGVSAWSTKDYDFVIGTLYNGEYHLIHITKGIVETFKGTDVTIKGQIK